MTYYQSWIILCVWVFVLEHPFLQASPPNVILILADDMAVGDISAFNDGRSRTPNLDRLLSESVWFEQAYSGAPVCSPSRATLLTGRYAHRTGVVSLDMNSEPTLTRLHRDETTMADVFQKNGYRTGLIGKWHTGLGDGYGPESRGFDEFEGFHGSSKTGYFRYAIQMDDAMGDPEKLQDRYLTDELSNRAIQFVRRNADKPFFLHLAHYAPHRPLEAPEEAIRSFRESGMDEETATVYAMIEIMDRGVGELIEELKRLGIEENTIVLFSSDNGPDSLVSTRFNRGLKGTKYTVNEGGIRVPFMVRWPPHWSAIQRTEPIHFSDVLPTLIELCGLKHASTLPLDGRSFAKLFSDPNLFESQDRFWQWNRHEPDYTHNAAMRSGRWKLVRPFVTKNKTVESSRLPMQLYDIERDPFEQLDVAADNPEQVATMQVKLDIWSREVENDRKR